MNRRRARRLLFVACTAAGMAASASTSSSAARAVTGVCPARPGQAVVPVVVDFGAAGDGARALCIAVDPGTDAATVLEERARLLGTPAPRYADSGLLCAIDGIPETGCGERTASGYRYWSYWKGESGTWLYQTVGPADRRAGDAIVEGWRFQTGDGEGRDQPPRRSPATPIDAVVTPAVAGGARGGGLSGGDGDGGGSAVGLLAGAAVVAAVAGSAVLVTRRRRIERA